MYAEINPKLSYNKGVNSWSDKPFESNSAYPKFNSTTQNISNQNTDQNYCGGQSSLALRGMQMNNTPLSVAYFSNKNMSRIQKYIKREVFRQSKGEYVLDVDQDEMDLLLVMRAVFFENARHLPTDIDGQVNELDRLVLRDIVPGMMTNISQQMGYLRDISQPIQPIALPLNVNNGGRRSLPSVTNLWR
jgi:hypothetical protein